MVRRFVLIAALLPCSLFAAEPGIPLGVQFRVPVVNSAGRTVQARAVIAADKSLRLMFVDGDDIADLGYRLEKLGSVEPTPPTPTPVPTPQPQPVPQPTPTPTPTPQPKPDEITVGPLHVLFLYESEQLGKMTPEQASILSSKLIRDYLVAKCDKDGSEPCFRFLDKDVDASKLADDWQKVIAAGKAQTMPWIIIANAKSNYAGPWPKDVATTLELLQRYGGK